MVTFVSSLKPSCPILLVNYDFHLLRSYVSRAIVYHSSYDSFPNSRHLLQGLYWPLTLTLTLISTITHNTFFHNPPSHNTLSPSTHSYTTHFPIILSHMTHFCFNTFTSISSLISYISCHTFLHNAFPHNTISHNRTLRCIDG